MKQKNKDGTVREYLCVVESYRKEGKIKQRMIANLGRMGEEITPKKIDSLMTHLEKHANKVQIANILKDLRMKASKTYAEIEIFRRVWKDLGIEATLRHQVNDTEKQIDYVEAIFMAVCNRLRDPKSKKGASEWKETVYEPKWNPLALHHVYRGMDHLLSKKDEIESELFSQGRTLFNCEVNVAMFDTTTVSYWGKGEDEIFQRGHAKNKRFDLKQLVVGIVMDQDGTPLGHEVWPGNMSDKPAFKAVIDKIRKKFLIEKVILVCDKGMVSEENIAYLEANGYEYILSAKMRQMSEIRQRLLLNDEGFVPLYDGTRYGKEITEGDLWHKELIEQHDMKLRQAKSKHLVRPLDEEAIQTYKDSPKGKRRWVVCLNPLLAKEDQAKREYFQKILENKVAFATAKDWIVKNGYKKYVKLSEFSIELDESRLQKDALYDGKWCLITNTGLPIASLVRVYKDLAQIEQLFRTLKSELEVGPIYHFVERRVRGHIFICFLALQIRTYIKKQIKQIDPSLSYSQVMQDVSQIKACIYEFKDHQYIQRTQFQGNAHIAFRATGTKIPPDFLSISPSQTPSALQINS